MSIKIMSQAWGATVKGADKLGLLALADYANDNGLAYPSYDTFAGKVGTSRRQALRIIDKLEAAGEIYKAPNPKTTAVNHYVVVTGLNEAEIAQRLVSALRMSAKEAKAVASDIFGKRPTSVVNVTSNEATSDIDDTSTSDTHDIELVTSVSPYPLKNRHSEPSTEKGVATNDPLPTTPPSPATPKEPKLTEHPFVVVYHEVFRRYPSTAKMAQLAKLIVTPQDLDRWRTACEAWVLCPYDPSNIRGILDWYSNGVPDRQNGKGQSLKDVSKRTETRTVGGVVQEKIGGVWYNKRTDSPTGAA